MFRNRRNSQKPNEDFYAAFKQSHPGASAALHGATTSTAVAGAMAAIMPPSSSTSFSNAITDTALDAGPFDNDDHFKGADLSPHGDDQWRLTPTLMDAHSFSFANLSNQPSGYYTPTPGGMNTIYHNPAAGDLHTPGMSFNLGTPLSMPLTDAAMNAAPTFDMPGFHPQVFQNQDFHFQPQQQQQQQQVYGSRMLVHQDSGYGALEGSPDNDFDMKSSSAHEPTGSLEPPSRVEQSALARVPSSLNNFRYQVTLNAPTAMVRQSDEIPITYLNKGQAYTISIVDSRPAGPPPSPVKYRTVVRISFEDDQQRQRPSGCWQLWKEGRGLSESHQRGGKLQAVEFVDPHPGTEEDPRQPRVELENASFDGFAVTWTPSIATTTAECSVAVRFNFLSTDFSHSKGVKGIPVRLCAKTTQILEDDTEVVKPDAEVCYCKVKLFRDHGAERKLSNDIAHVRKTIEKLKQQIAQVEAGIKDPSKRKRTASLAMSKMSERPSKIQKRTWSLSSTDGTPSGRPAIEDDLHQRLSAVQAMFSSTRPVSVLYLQGGEQDDPDLFPVALPGDRADGKSSAIGKESWLDSSELSPTGGSSIASPMSSAHGEPQPEFKRPKNPRTESVDWPMSATLPSTNFHQALDSIRARPVKITRDNGATIDAVDVDPTYVPPAQQVPKPIACFYAQIAPPSDAGSVASRKPLPFYRAIYLSQRSIGALVSGIASKSSLDPARIQRTVRTTPAGLQVLVDDEVVRELSEGQDMRVTFAETEDRSEFIKQEDRLAVPGTSPQPDSNVTTPLESTPLEMRLAF